ncbi:hypothetical protein TNCV_3953761 [Trichonephila clavipes]|nr:hypothetical protein TNCV_3953761 [Trichonephila clavipes]
MLKAVSRTGTTTKMTKASKVNFKSCGISIPTICEVTSLSHFSRQALYHLGGIGQGRPEPSLHVNDISRICWSQHLLTTQSEWPN